MLEFKEFCTKLTHEAQSKRTSANASLYSDVNKQDDLIKLRLGYDLYYFTKDFLEKNKGKLTGEEKGRVFIEYVNTWTTLNCKLKLEMVGYGDGSDSHYNDKKPMTVGFELQGADIVFKDGTFSLAAFILVNLRGARIYSSIFTVHEVGFKYCDLAGFQLKGESSYPKFVFEGCNLLGADFSGCSINDGADT